MSFIALSRFRPMFLFRRLCLAVFLLTSPLLRAESVDWGVVQRQLQADGLYYGKIDGRSGPETLAAVNRFQIRKGLPVTGEVDAATWTALTTGAEDAPGAAVSAQPAPAAPVTVLASTGPTPLLSTWYEPVVTNGSEEVLTLDQLFAETQLADRSSSRKSSALRSIQVKLREADVYAGGIDGDPGPKTHQALLDYQAKYGLVQSGAADSATLAAMQLNESTLGAQPERSTRQRSSRGGGDDENVLRRSGRSVGRFIRRIF